MDTHAHADSNDLALPVVVSIMVGYDRTMLVHDRTSYRKSLAPFLSVDTITLPEGNAELHHALPSLIGSIAQASSDTGPE